MQVLSITIGQVLRPVLKVKLMFLGDEILTRINTLEDKDQMELIALVIPKLSGEDFLEVLSRALNFKDNLYLSKGLLLVELLPYVPSEYFIQVSKEILRCIGIAKKNQKQADELELINSFLSQLENQQNNPDLSDFLIEISQELSNFRVGLDFTNRIAMAGRCFKLMHHSNPNKRYPSYEREKASILQFAKELKILDNKYLFLLGLLEHYPLAQEERLEIIKLALEALEALETLSFSLERHNKSSKDKGNVNVAAPDKSSNQLDYVPLREKIKLLGFLSKQEKKQLALMLLEEISQTGQSLMDELENIITYLGHCCWKQAGEEKIFEIKDEAIKEVSDLIGFLYKYDKRDDQDNFEVIRFLTSKRFFEMVRYVWSDLILDLIERINSPITKADSLILLLQVEKSSSFKNKLIKQTLATISLIKGESEKLILTVKLIQALNRKNRREIVPKLLTEIALLPSTNEMIKAELLVAVLPYLTPIERREAFLVANTLENEFDRNWATIAFTNYLTKHKKAKVIESGLSMIDSDSSDEEKVLLLKQFIQYSLPDLPDSPKLSE